MASFVLKDSHELDLFNLNIPCERIHLVSLSEKFVDAIFSEFTNEITTFMVPAPAHNKSETLDFIINSRLNMKKLTEVVFAITDLNGHFLGCLGLHCRTSSRTPDVGIWLKKTAHGHKYGQEAVRFLLAWAHQHFIFDYAIYPVAKNNIASCKIPQSLNGIIFDSDNEMTFHGGVFPSVYYRIDAQEVD